MAKLSERGVNKGELLLITIFCFISLYLVLFR